MEAVLRFLETYEMWIYGIAGALALFWLARLVSSWQEWRGAIFGLERDSAQRRFATSMTIFIVILLFSMAEFILVSFVSPALPQAQALATPTLDILATATAPVVGAGTPNAPTQAVVEALAAVPEGRCIPGQVEWIQPKAGEEISATVTLLGSVNVPDFGFYKYEYSQPGSDNWMTIAAGNALVTEANKNELGVWNTSQMVPGDYLLRLVVVDNQNQPLPACIIPIRITAPE